MYVLCALRRAGWSIHKLSLFHNHNVIIVFMCVAQSLYLPVAYTGCLCMQCGAVVCSVVTFLGNFNHSFNVVNNKPGQFPCVGLAWNILCVHFLGDNNFPSPIYGDWFHESRSQTVILISGNETKIQELPMATSSFLFKTRLRSLLYSLAGTTLGKHRTIVPSSNVVSVSGTLCLYPVKAAPLGDQQPRAEGATLHHHHHAFSLAYSSRIYFVRNYISRSFPSRFSEQCCYVLPKQSTERHIKTSEQ